MGINTSKILSRKNRTGLSLPGETAWSPEQEASLVAWYQYQTGITLNGSDVSEWADYTGNYDMVQATASRQPAYSSGTLTFVSADTQFLQTTGQLDMASQLAGDFTIGFRVQPDPGYLGAVLGSNTLVQEFIRFNGANNLKVIIKEGSIADSVDFAISSAGDDYYVLTRSGSDISLRQNGVLSVTTFTSSNTVDIDAIGVRKTNQSPFNGTMKEIQIYSSTSTALTANVQARLASL